MPSNALDSPWTRQVHPVGISMINGDVGEDSPAVKYQCGQESGPKLGFGYSRQRLSRSLCSFRVELSHQSLNSPGNSKTRRPEASVGLALSNPPGIQHPPLRMGFMTPTCHIGCLPPPFLQLAHRVWCGSSARAPCARHGARLWVVTECV